MNKLDLTKKGKREQTSIVDIAKKLHIAPSTVSRALSNHPKISEKTKKKVIECANRMNYKHNQIASSLRTGKTNTIGVIVPRLYSHFISSVISGIESVTNEAGYNIIICQSSENLKNEKNCIKTLLSSRVDGILISVSMETVNDDHLRDISQMNVPFLFFDRALKNSKACSVTSNDFLGAYTATEHLIKQGCRKIAHIGGHLNLNIYEQRLKGFKKALTDNHLKVDESLIFNSGEMTNNTGMEFAEKLWNGNNVPDGIFASNDNMATGVMTFFIGKGKKIPEDIAIVGYSNASFTQWITPALSSVEQHSRQIGIEAAKLIIKEIEADKEADTKDLQTENVVLNPELIIRASSNRINP